jgi:hypothetical protein
MQELPLKTMADSRDEGATLQIIGAGFGRTGTTSMKTALKQLGFGPCYHMTELGAHPDDILHGVISSMAGDNGAKQTGRSWRRSSRTTLQQ